MQREVLAGGQDDGVPGVVATLIANHPLHAATEQVGGLTFALVAPLGADEDDCRHDTLPPGLACLRLLIVVQPVTYPTEQVARYFKNGLNIGVNTAENTPSAAVLVVGDLPAPRRLTGLPRHRLDDPAAIDLDRYRRLIVVGNDADLAAVLTRLVRAERLDVEVAYVPRRRTTATRAYRLPAGRRAARRARWGSARRAPLIRDETGSVIVGRAGWLPPDDAPCLHGEAVVDDTVLFDGDAAEVWIEPTLGLPGLRATLNGTGPWRRWISGRAAQLGTTGVTVVRDGVPAARTARRSTFYRNVEGWLLVR